MLYFVQFDDIATVLPNTDAVNLIPQLLDGIITLGNIAQQISRALGGNGHRAEVVKGLIRELSLEK